MCIRDPTGEFFEGKDKYEWFSNAGNKFYINGKKIDTEYTDQANDPC